MDSCYRCSGRHVEPVIDKENLSKEQKEMLEVLNKQLNSIAQSRREDEYCRRMRF